MRYELKIPPHVDHVAPDVAMLLAVMLNAWPVTDA